MNTLSMGSSATKWLGCGVVALGIAACSSDKTPARQPSDLAAESRSNAATARNDNDTTIQISDDFRRECQLPNAPQEAPHFDYADSTLHARGQNILDDVAKCLSEGPLKGRTMTIIGRTDPRGSADYNKQLSANRAEAARNYLAQRGVPAANIRLVAQGARGARGNDEASWALDRRVDFELGDRTGANNVANNNLNASPSPILEGTRMDTAPANTGSPASKGAASYADTAEGGKEVSGSGKGSSSGSTSASGSVSVGK